MVMHYQKPIIKRGYSKRPFPTISWQTQKYVDQFVKFNHFHISKVPPAIKKPKLPPVENLVRGKFEKTAEFKIRVKEAMDKRDRELLAIQEKYRDEVESRNRILDNFQKVNSKVALLKDISIEKFQNRATKWALDDVIKQKGFKLTPLDYNADSEELLAEVKSKNSSWSKKVKISVPPHQAEKIYKSPENYQTALD